MLGAGQLEEVRVQREKGFGFVRYSNHSETARAIQMGNAKILCGKPIKVILQFNAVSNKTMITTSIM